MEKDFEVWLQSVSDAFYGAGLFSIYRLSAYPSDVLAAMADRAHYVRIPPDYAPHVDCLAGLNRFRDYRLRYARYCGAWRFVGLLRILRANYERKSTPFRHQLLSDMANTVQADFVGVRQYVAALDVYFTRLSKLNHDC